MGESMAEYEWNKETDCGNRSPFFPPRRKNLYKEKQMFYIKSKG